MKSRVFVGMSGGVDSSAAALLLKNNNFEVVGITMRLKDGEASLKDENDAAGVAAAIGIEHRVVDFRKEFQKEVVGYFVSEYLAGFTPNPCVVCNKKIKFGIMLDYALENGADFIATGHYAKIKKIENEFFLQNTDNVKDQSYFLHRLSQKQLSHSIFPLEGIDKEEIRKIARESGLPVASKSDSQEICFVPNDDYAAYLNSLEIKLPPAGDFVDAAGNAIGRHKGIVNYTVGQRKGLGAFGRPMYVSSISVEKNTVTLGENGSQYSGALIAGNMHWINEKRKKTEFRAAVKIRFRSPAENAVITIEENEKIRIVFERPVRSVTPGQFAVLYDGATLIGGARIEKSL